MLYLSPFGKSLEFCTCISRNNFSTAKEMTVHFCLVCNTFAHVLYIYSTVYSSTVVYITTEFYENL